MGLEKVPTEPWIAIILWGKASELPIHSDDVNMSVTWVMGAFWIGPSLGADDDLQWRPPGGGCGRYHLSHRRQIEPEGDDQT